MCDSYFSHVDLDVFVDLVCVFNVYINSKIARDIVIVGREIVRPLVFCVYVKTYWLR